MLAEIGDKSSSDATFNAWGVRCGSGFSRDKGPRPWLKSFLHSAPPYWIRRSLGKPEQLPWDFIKPNYWLPEFLIFLAFRPAQLMGNELKFMSTELRGSARCLK